MKAFGVAYLFLILTGLPVNADIIYFKDGMKTICQEKALKHKSYNEAIQTLATEYGRSPQWIQENMGNSNDLNEIHQNLRNAD